MTTHDWWGIVTESTLPIHTLVDAIRNGTAIAVTDGSFKDGLGTAAFTFRCEEQDPRALTFVHMTPGMPVDITAYRTEIGRLYGVASFLGRLHERYDLGGGHVTVACDCRGGLNRALQTFPPDPKVPNFDLISEIYNLRNKTPVRWTGKWVRGHQDEIGETVVLDRWAQLNIAMDQLAKQHWQRLSTNRPRPFSLPANEGTWSVWMQEERITQWNKNAADQLYFNASTRTYWAQKYAHFDRLDYGAIWMAYKSLNLFYQLRIPKWIGRRLPVGSILATWSTDRPSVCPRCGLENETHQHVITCQHPGAIALKDSWLDQLELWLACKITKADLRFGIISILRAAMRGSAWIPTNTNDPGVRTTFQNQQSIGESDLLFGWWHKDWAAIQHAYLQSIAKRNTGQRWLARLIKKQWEISWDLWRHRLQIAASPDSRAVAFVHEQLNQEISDLYAQLSTIPYPPLQRWFRQPLEVLLQQPLSFKQDWRTLVRSFHDLAHPIEE